MQKIKIAALGPKGTFSHEAARTYLQSLDLGDASLKDALAKIEFAKTVNDVFELVDSDKSTHGIVPIENSESGSIGLTLDAFMEYDLNIIAEEILPVRHNLAGRQKKPIKTIYCHPQTYSQCENFIRKNYSDAEIIETSSNGKSAEILKNLISEGKDDDVAAIVPLFAAELNGIPIIKKNIHDNKFNITRFVVISKDDSNKTGEDRTSIAIYPQRDRPGLLYDLLGEFAKRKINLSKIESRPSKGKLGDYIFFIDFVGHKEDSIVKEAFKAIERDFFLKVLGSYPKKY